MKSASHTISYKLKLHSLRYHNRYGMDYGVVIHGKQQQQQQQLDLKYFLEWMCVCVWVDERFL